MPDQETDVPKTAKRPAKPRRLNPLAIIGPGLLVAATGVGAGDLATAGFSGSKLGVAVLWAVIVGAGLKYVLNEGLTRWQLATGDTLLEGCMAHLGIPFQILFILYLIPWSFFVGAALISACGVTVNAMIPVFTEPRHGKIVFGIAQSVLGVVLIRCGGYRLFEKVMKVCVAIMFVTVLVTAVLIRPDWIAVLRGLVTPVIPQADSGGVAWTVALIGGVGGTLTILCYGYWIREEGRMDISDLKPCRIDLAVGYGATALFGIAMVIIGSSVVVEGKGAGLIASLADCLGEPLGPVGRWAFLLGAWGAVFSSLLGVWQSVPYIFADFCGMALGDTKDERAQRVSARSPSYRLYLYGLAVIPMIGLKFGFRDIQKYYAVIGACFMPFVAGVLLYLNGRSTWVGKDHRNRALATLCLIATLVFFLVTGGMQVRKKFQRPRPTPRTEVKVGLLTAHPDLPPLG